MSQHGKIEVEVPEPHSTRGIEMANTTLALSFVVGAQRLVTN
jgi:hypothetical protein